MITRTELTEKCRALQELVALPNDGANMEKKRSGVKALSEKLEQTCPFVKDYGHCPGYGMADLQKDIESRDTHVNDIILFVENHYTEILEYEDLDEETKKMYAEKLAEYHRPDFFTLPLNGNDHDGVFMSFGSYRLFCTYQNDQVYLVARKMRDDLMNDGGGEFRQCFAAYLLYSATLNELARMERTVHRIDALAKLGEASEGDPYADVDPSQFPDDTIIFYNFWGGSLSKKQEQFSKLEVPTGDEKAVFLPPYNYRKLVLEFIKIYQNVRMEWENQVPEKSKNELEKLIWKLFDDYSKREVKASDPRFDDISSKLAYWVDRTIGAASEAQKAVPTIVCYESRCDGEASSACILEYVDEYSRKILEERLYRYAFEPGRIKDILFYDFWEDEFQQLQKKYKDKRGLTDEQRALFYKIDNNALFLKKVNNLLAGGNTDVRVKFRDFLQNQFFLYNEKLRMHDLTDGENLNAALGWLYFTRREVESVDLEGELGSKEIIDEMESRYLAESEKPLTEIGFLPKNGELKLDRLYEYLVRVDVRVIEVSREEFEHAVRFADFQKMLEDAKKLRSKYKVLIVIQRLRTQFYDNWYCKVSDNCGLSKSDLSNTHVNSGESLKKFKKAIDGLPLT